MIKVKVRAIAGQGNDNEDFLEFEDTVTSEDIHQDCLEYAIDVTGFEFSWEVVEGAITCGVPATHHESNLNRKPRTEEEK